MTQFIYIFNIKFHTFSFIISGGRKRNGASGGGGLYWAAQFGRQ